MKIYSSEYISSGHPDKLADLISDAVLDEYLKIDKDSHVACETLISHNLVVIAGEVTTSKSFDIDYKNIINNVLKSEGYGEPESGFNIEQYKLVVNINQQSQNIYDAVNNSFEIRSNYSNHENDKIGAGDQGIVIGFACDETDVYMPIAYIIARELVNKVEYLRKEKKLKYLRPVCKSLVTVSFEDDMIHVESIVLSTQHSSDVKNDTIVKDLLTLVINESKYSHYIDDNTRILINPSGNFCIGGPQADTGLTGRKIIVDSYGGRVRHGGGAFSGKDPTKIDRSGAYLCRWIAKNIVAQGYAKQCEVELTYAIGVANPLILSLNCFSTETVPIATLKKAIYNTFEMQPMAIIKKLGLLEPIYEETVRKGHFGYNDCFPWETEKLIIFD